MSILSACAWALGRLLPINPRKVVVSSFYGRGCSDSPRAIAAALVKANPQLKVICLIDRGRSTDTPKGVLVKSNAALSRVYQLSTAKVWIDNCRKGAPYKKKEQYYLQTWHGFALKRIEKDVVDTLPASYEPYARRDSAQCDVIVSGSRHMSDIYRRSFWFDGDTPLTGTPRNDILFLDSTPVRRKVCQVLHLPENRKLLLYAPTFRADHSTEAYRLDCEKLLKACTERFSGDWTVLIRLHPNIDSLSQKLFAYDDSTLVNASLYPDMQELLCACDVVITDYSSVIFDFALTLRPCFLFATDIDDYRKDRNFYMPIDSLPFPLSTDNEQLSQQILHFDELQWKSAWAAFVRDYGIEEDGHASERCVRLLLEHLPKAKEEP